MKNLSILILISCFFINKIALSQHEIPSGSLIEKKRKFQLYDMGFLIGHAITGEKLPENISYRPTLIMANIPFKFAQIINKKGRRHYFLIALEPQFNFNNRDSVIKANHNKAFDIEFGVTVGLRYDYEIFRRQFIYGMIGTGPHYISLKTKIQARGFIFSDNFVVGTYREFGKMRLNLQCRFRHMSNANLKKPNKGIDNFFILAGVSVPMEVFKKE